MIEEPEYLDQEEDLNLLKGEYIYDGYQIIGADININDVGHIGYIQQQISGMYAEELVDIANEIIEKLEDSEELEELEELKDNKDQVEKNIYEDHDPDKVFSLYDSIKKISPQSVSNPKLTEAMKALENDGDAREYGCKHLDYIIIRNENFEVWELNSHTAKKIVNAAYEIVNHENINQLPKQKIVVTSFKTGKDREYTIGDLEQGNLFVTPTMPTTKANVFIPSLKPKKYNAQTRPAGLSPTQYHQAISTSENFSFKEWFKKEEILDEVIKKAPWSTNITRFLGKNPKTSKSDILVQKGYASGVDQESIKQALLKPDGSSYDDFDTYLIHFTPAAQSGFITCKCSSSGCASECLHTAGNLGALADKTFVRLMRTFELAKEGPILIDKLKKTIKTRLDKAESQNKKLVIRLNGTSDFDWREFAGSNGKNVFEEFPTTQFYDYTKASDHFDNMPPNYHLTFSRSEKNYKKAKELIEKGHNVAVVFGPGKVGGDDVFYPKKVSEQTINELKLANLIPKDYVYPIKKELIGKILLPLKFDGYDVVNGDNHDLRFLEKSKAEKGFIIGLTAKGTSSFENFDIKQDKFLSNYEGDKEGFVVQPNDNKIIQYPENYDFIVAANDLINIRNKKQKSQKMNYARSKNLAAEKQAIIEYVLFDDDRYLKPIILNMPEYQGMAYADALKVYMKNLSNEKWIETAMNQMTSFKKELVAFCGKPENEERCNKLYLNPVLDISKTSGGSTYVSPTKDSRPTFARKLNLPMANKPNDPLSLIRTGTLTEFPKST